MTYLCFVQEIPYFNEESCLWLANVVEVGWVWVCDVNIMSYFYFYVIFWWDTFREISQSKMAKEDFGTVSSNTTDSVQFAVSLIYEGCQLAPLQLFR